ncbi:MAG: hypothetical protein NWQ51_02770, partial [OM182 bacterium]|nr:hypothetical protein [OM182 bacterium]
LRRANRHLFAALYSLMSLNLFGIVLMGSPEGTRGSLFVECVSDAETRLTLSQLIGTGFAIPLGSRQKPRLRRPNGER